MILINDLYYNGTKISSRRQFQGVDMKWFRSLKLVLLISLSPFMKTYAKELRPWIYFDLGDTVISTKDMKHLKYFRGAKDYIIGLKDKGYKVGLITNIPETFGSDYQEKFETLKKVIHDGWDDSENFDWEVFDAVFLPLKNNEMKPASHLFQKALNETQGCPAMYLSESENEIKAANTHGFATKLFVEGEKDLYVPLEKLTPFIKHEFKKEYNEECFNQIS